MQELDLLNRRMGRFKRFYGKEEWPKSGAHVWAYCNEKVALSGAWGANARKLIFG